MISHWAGVAGCRTGQCQMENSIMRASFSLPVNPAMFSFSVESLISFEDSYETIWTHSFHKPFETMNHPSKKELFVFGYNSFGCIGLGDDDVNKVIMDPRKLNVPSTMWTQVACGNYHNATVSSNGEVFTWGWGGDGQLGHGDSNDRRVPTKVEIPEGEVVVKVACGSYHTVAVTRTGKLFTWYVSC